MGMVRQQHPAVEFGRSLSHLEARRWFFKGFWRVFWRFTLFRAGCRDEPFPYTVPLAAYVRGKRRCRNLPG